MRGRAPFLQIRDSPRFAADTVGTRCLDVPRAARSVTGAADCRAARAACAPRAARRCARVRRKTEGPSSPTALATSITADGRGVER